MADIRFNAIPTTAASVNSDDYTPIDGATFGTRKIQPANILVNSSSYASAAGTVTSASFAQTSANSSFATSASYAVSASYAPSTAGSTATGSVTSVSVVTANGVSGVVANQTTTPAITFTLGNITPTSVSSSFTGSFLGTASFATNAQTYSASLTATVTSLSASLALATSSITTVSASVSVTETANSASIATVSVRLASLSSSFNSTQISGSIISGSQLTGSLFGTASFALSASYSFAAVSASYAPTSGTSATGSVTTVAVTTANGVSGIVANATTTPSITLTLGNISPTQITSSFNGPHTGSVFGTASYSVSASWAPTSGTTATGSVTTVSVATANGISGTVANATTAPAITLTLGNIAPTSVTSSFNGAHTGSLFGTASYAATSSFASSASSSSTPPINDSSVKIATTAYVSPATQVISTATSSLDCSKTRTFSQTLAANSIFTLNNMADGNGGAVSVALTGASTYSASWVAGAGYTGVHWAAGTAPTQSLANMDIYTFLCFGTSIVGSVVQNVF